MDPHGQPQEVLVANESLAPGLPIPGPEAVGQPLYLRDKDVEYSIV